MQTAATAPPLAQADVKPEITVLTPHFDYFEQILPDPPTVCGLRLKPLSIGRYRLMARFKVAFVAESEATANAGDLLKGALICSMSCEDFDATASHPNFKKNLYQWGQKIGFFPPSKISWSGFFLLISKLLGKQVHQRIADYLLQSDARYLSEQTDLFQKYITDGAPDLSKRFWNEPSEEIHSGTHWSQNIEAVLREYQNWGEREVNETPLTKALWDFYKHLENRGIGRFMSPEEQAEMTTPLTPEQIAEVEENNRKIREFLDKKQARQNG